MGEMDGFTPNTANLNYAPDINYTPQSTKKARRQGFGPACPGPKWYFMGGVQKAFIRRDYGNLEKLTLSKCRKIVIPACIIRVIMAKANGKKIRR
jgi:hypothetical protein